MAFKWSHTTLGHFCPFVYGKSLPVRSRNELGEVPVYGSSGITGMHDVAFIEQPGIIIGRKGTVGAVYYSEGPFWPIDTTFFVTDSDKRDLRFTYYLLKSLPLDQMDSDSAVPGLNRNRAHAVKIKVPGPEGQHCIAHILGTLDDKIELNRRMNQTLEAMVAAIFKSWFIDFDPVHARAEGRDTGLPAEIADLFPSEFEESEIGAIPKGWEAGSMGDVTTNIRDSLKPEYIDPDDVYVGLNHFDRHCLTLWNSGHGREVTSNKNVFQKGDILFGKLRPYFHKVAIAPNDGVCSTDVLVLRANNEQWQAFASLALFQDGIIEYATQTSNGTRMPRAKWATLSTYPVALPGDMLAAEFESFVGDMLERMRRHVAENRTLVALRDALLPKLLNGVIDLSDAEVTNDEMTAAV